MMFPEIEETAISTEVQETTTMGKSFLFDFDTGDFTTIDGKVVQATGLDAIKVWINKILNTEKFKFKIYETDEQNEYGVSLLDFVNNDYPLDFVKIEIEREIKEALLENVEITSVGNFVFTREKRTLACSFTVETIYGVTGGEITI